VIRTLTRLANGLAIAANAAGTLVVLGLVVIVNYDVGARNFLHRPFMGAVEVVQFSMVLIVFLQLPDVVRVGRLTRSDGFLLVIGGRYPGFARALRRAINAVSCVFMLLIAVTIWPEFMKMLASSDYFGVPGVFTALWWPVKLTIFGSAALAAVIFALKVLGSIADDARHVPKPKASQ